MAQNLSEFTPSGRLEDYQSYIDELEMRQKELLRMIGLVLKKMPQEQVEITQRDMVDFNPSEYALVIDKSLKDYSKTIRLRRI